MTDNVIRHYDRLLREKTTAHDKVGWGSGASQQARFAILAEIGDLKRASVLDVGCGSGDLYAWLAEKKVGCSYHGVDINARMIDEARTRFPGAKFDVLNILTTDQTDQYDWVFLSGALTIATDRQEELVEVMLRRMFAIARRGVAANFLSNRADFIESGEYYASPGHLLEYCLSLTRRVALRHDYMTHDVTVFLYREGHSE